MIYMVDIDGTIFNTVDRDYVNSQPIPERIEHFNKLYDEGHTIKYWTARGSGSGKDWYNLTLTQLQNAGVKFHSFNTGKPSYDLWIDDKAVNVDAYFTDRS
jgi:hypothetical protein